MKCPNCNATLKCVRTEHRKSGDTYRTYKCLSDECSVVTNYHTVESFSDWMKEVKEQIKSAPVTKKSAKVEDEAVAKWKRPKVLDSDGNELTVEQIRSRLEHPHLYSATARAHGKVHTKEGDDAVDDFGLSEDM